MKKISAVILIIVITASMFSVNIFAASAVIRSEQGTYTFDYEANKEFDVTFVVDNNPGICTSSFIVEYDPDVIQAVASSDKSTDGYLSYEKSPGNTVRFISTTSFNQQLALVPSSGGGKTSAELGSIRMAEMAVTDNFDFVTITGDLKFFTLRFKIVGSGTTDIDIVGFGGDTNNIITKGEDPDGDYSKYWENIPVTIQPAKVVIGAKSSQTATEDTTQTTTAKTTTTQTTTTAKTTTSKSTAKTNTVTTATTQTTTESATQTTTENAVQADTVAAFTDTAAYPWAEEAIEALAAKGIVNGIGNGMFNPSANVKRADFMIMLVNALGLNADFTDNFTDVTSDKYYYNAVGVAKALGIANGQGNNLYNPEAFISRQDMMVLAERAVELNYELEAADTSVLDRFADKDTISAYALDSLAVMVNAGVVNGTGDNVEPKAYTTRAQAAVIIYNIINLLG